MNARHFSVVTLLALVSSGRAGASDLELTIRPHADRVLFGDPVYVEVTIVNRGNERVSATPALYHGDRFRFEIQDPQTGLFIWQFNADGERSPNDIQPNKSVRFVQYLFLPRAYDFTHRFWNPVRDGQTISICGVYPLSSSGVELRSQWHHVVVEARDEREMRALEHWAKAEVPGFEPGPKVSNYGLRVLRPLNREHTGQFAGQIRSGEIGDLLQLTLQMQGLFAMKPEEREAGNERLVGWLHKQANIKRQALAIQSRSLAEAYRMTSTQQALEQLIADVKSNEAEQNKGDEQNGSTEETK